MSLRRTNEFLPKLKEWMEHLKGKIRAAVAHDRLLALGYAGWNGRPAARSRRRGRRSRRWI
jgi:hypothetical protein